jgi:hypothetical protein
MCAPSANGARIGRQRFEGSILLPLGCWRPFQHCMVTDGHFAHVWGETPTVAEPPSAGGVAALARSYQNIGETR